MQTLSLPFGWIYCCTREEAKNVWKEEPKNRGRIWLQSEVKSYTLSDYDEVEKAYNSKMQRPGLKL